MLLTLIREVPIRILTLKPTTLIFQVPSLTASLYITVKPKVKEIV